MNTWSSNAKILTISGMYFEHLRGEEKKKIAWKMEKRLLKERKPMEGPRDLTYFVIISAATKHNSIIIYLKNNMFRQGEDEREMTLLWSNLLLSVINSEE